MTLPWWPVIWLDVFGSLLTLGMAFHCVFISHKWSKRNPDDPFKHYIFMLTLTIGAFAISRGIGHVLKQALIAADQMVLWSKISPYSSAANTATFVMIASFSVYFTRQDKIKQQFKQTALDLERTKATARLAAENETRLLTIFDNMEDAVFLIDSDYRICFFNRKLQSLLPQCVIDASCYQVMMERENPCPGCRLDEVIEQGKSFNKEVYMPGMNRMFNMTEIPLTWTNGKKVKLNVGRDITEHKQLEEQLRHSQKMEAIGTLAGGVAHDINNSLTPIIGYSELMLMGMTADNPLAPRLEHIKKSALRASEMISRILAYSRRQVIKKTRMDINDLIRSTSEMFTSLLEENINLDLKLSAQALPVHIDSAQLEQVLANLVVNARDAMPKAKGGVILFETMISDDQEILCQSCGKKTTGSHVLLMVSDNGGGMTAATRNRIFEPYFTTKGLEKGTGLGLAMVHGIIHQHGGHINVDSEPGLGTTFTIYLPAAGPDDRTAAGPARETDQITVHGRETILVVEDDEQVRKITTDCLKSFGYQVLVANSGQQALDISGQPDQRIDLLLTDLIMPDTNGRQLAERIQAMRPSLCVLYMSGYTDNVIAHHGVLDPDIHFLSKPFSTASLARKVREALG